MTRLTVGARSALCAVAAGTFALELLLARPPAARSQDAPRNLVSAPNASGVATTLFTGGATFDPGNPFFHSLGTNGRSCATCHDPRTGWSLTPALAQARFRATGGLDPLFAPVDGANSPDLDRSSVDARWAASTMLLRKGLIRVGIGIPANAEFSLEAVDDPYGYASAKELSLFRRPLPATNLRFLTAVMFDGRESTPPDTASLSPTWSDADNVTALLDDLKHQARDATLGHAQAATAPDDQTLERIARFEMSTVTAQSVDAGAGRLYVDGALGGPSNLASQAFYVGINDVLGADRSGKPFDPSAMALYSAWLSSPDARRRQLARGAVLFNSKPIDITGVGGLNDELKTTVIKGTCTSCHDAPNVGNHSVPLAINIGTSTASRRTPDLPLYTLRNTATGETVQTTDPGRALITGRWKDIGKFKGPVLRALATRAPYFHDGSAATLADVVDFYDARFGIGFTAQEKADLVAFLRAL